MVTMKNKKVVAIGSVPVGVTPGKPHSHISEIFVAGDLEEPEGMGIRNVMDEMNRGIRFYVLGNHSGVEIALETMDCAECGRPQVAIHPDDPEDEDLLNLPGRWELPGHW